MSARRPAVRALSGAGGKGPACFLIETADTRLLFDLGYGPQPGLWPDLTGVGRVDAIVLSHAHADHAGALTLAAQVGSPPVFATRAVLAQLATPLATHELPLHGTATVCGITVTTGRNGHAPGGVWLYAAIGDGILYTGDYSTESLLYGYDAPPPAATVILDASYGVYDEPLAHCMSKLAPHVGGNCLLPVPVMGRGAEMALHLASTGEPPRLGHDLRQGLRTLSGDPDSYGVRPERVASLTRLAELAPGPDEGRGVLLTSPADGSRGEAAGLVARWAQGDDAIVFTGYLPPGTPAQQLTDSQRALYIRWNVHPRLSDNAALVRDVGARNVLPAFGDRRHQAAWADAFAPTRLFFDETITL